jgi:hypothetical protein
MICVDLVPKHNWEISCLLLSNVPIQTDNYPKWINSSRINPFGHSPDILFIDRVEK